MRSNHNTSSIANVITRFSVQAMSMLCTFGDATAQPWHLDPCAGPLSGRHSGTNLLFRNLSTVTVISGTYLPAISEPALKQPGSVVRLPRLIQRLS